MILEIAEAKEILKPILAAYEQIIGKGDMEAVAGFYSTDGVLVHKGNSWAYDRDRQLSPVLTFVSQRFYFCEEIFLLKMTLNLITQISNEVFEATSDLIVYKATFKTKVKANGAEFGGKFAQIYRNEGDQWLVIWDEFEA
ncbi:hypothetical protein PENTCL1PPCAC_14674 [Pristionchus entomophagus]|uniref:DUF4440 domain-containing protein n=1 Tax=Pristionchus entomophagus TaxID=358040 RepID=A0AAV5TFV9_9BILA|nr:hypothetical protein PENTCL1PPCAC_14674 [Pristionchus entomophagus]